MTGGTRTNGGSVGAGTESRGHPIHHRVGRFVFGDRIGFVLWLALLAVFAVLWRLTLVLTDSYVPANVLVAMAEGNLAVEALRFPLDAVGSGQVQQGMRSYEGTLYGRNYGQVALAVPVLWALRALSALADVRLVLAGAWSGAVMVAIHQFGVLANRDTAGRLFGATAGIVLFVASLPVATAFDVRLLPILALQFVNLVAAAFIGVFLYRLLAAFHGRHLGVGAGLVAGLATPVAFWATFPKRHVLVAALLVVGLYCFATSRDGATRPRLARAGAYASFGLIAWIHAFEGFFVVVVLGAVDLATAPMDRRDVGTIALALGLALLPTVLTNLLISGNPLVPPRLVGEGVGSGGFDPGPFVGVVDAGNALGGFIASALLGSGVRLGAVLFASVDRIVDIVVGSITGGLATLTELDRMGHVFLRGGNYDAYVSTATGYQPVELSVPESMPIVAGVLVLPVLGVLRVRRWRSVPTPGAVRSLTPLRQTDLLATSLAVVLTLVYLSRLPLHSQLTVRYLFPLYFLGLYGVARIPAVRDAVEDGWRTGLTTYLTAVVASVAVATVGLGAIAPARAEAVQAHAIVHLSAAALVVVVLVGRTGWPERIGRRWAAVALGGAAGVTTGYYVLAGLEYFTRGEYALDLVAILAESLSIL